MLCVTTAGELGSEMHSKSSWMGVLHMYIYLRYIKRKPSASHAVLQMSQCHPRVVIGKVKLHATEFKVHDV